jgi:hypothetical protein
MGQYRGRQLANLMQAAAVFAAYKAPAQRSTSGNAVHGTPAEVKELLLTYIQSTVIPALEATPDDRSGQPVPSADPRCAGGRIADYRFDLRAAAWYVDLTGCEQATLRLSQFDY